MSLQKSPRIDLKSYREFVASLPCASCGVHGKSQCSHYSGIRIHMFGGGRGRKCDDLYTAPLCYDKCHPAADNYELSDFDTRDMRRIDQSEMFEFWVLQTIGEAVRRGVIKIG